MRRLEKWAVAVAWALGCVAALGAASAGGERTLAAHVRFHPVEHQRPAVSSELCSRADAPPKIDGDLADPAWETALAARQFYHIGNGQSAAARTQTHVFFTWDDEHLYVAARCFDPKAGDLPGPEEGRRDGTFSWGNSIELFLDTNLDRRSYYQIAVDLFGNVWDGHHKPDDTLDRDWNANATVATGREADAWTVEMALPLENLGAGPLAGRAWGMNAGRNAGVFAGEGNTAWCGTYHNPAAFQRVLFASPGAASVTDLIRGEGVAGRNTVSGTVLSASRQARDVEVQCVLSLPGLDAKTERTRIHLPALGKADFALEYEIPLGWVANHPDATGSTMRVAVVDADTGRTLWGSTGRTAPPPVLALELDREVYAFEHLDGQGVLTLNVSPDLLQAGKVRLTLEREQEGTLRPVSEQMLACEDRMAVFSLPLEGLAPGDYRLTAALLAGDENGGAAEARFAKADGEAREAASGRIPMIVQPRPDGAKSWPVTTGVPFPSGVLRDGGHVRLLDPEGRETPCQTLTTARWTPFGYVQWLLLDFEASLASDQAATYHLEYGTEIRRASFETPLTVDETDERIVVNTGPLKFEIRKGSGRFLDAAWLDANGDGLFAEDEQILRSGEGAGAWLTHHTGETFSSAMGAPESVEIEEAGPQRVAIKLAGWKKSAAGARSGQYVTRIMAYANQPFLRVYHTFVLTEDSRKVRYPNIALGMRTTGIESVAVGGDGGAPIEAEGDMSLVQHGWDRYFTRGAAGRQEGRHGAGWITARGQTGAVTVTVQDFWQNYPTELEAAGNQLIVHFWPANNPPRRHGVEDINAHNMHMLYFAHEGEELDSQMPREYATTFTREAKPEFYYIPPAVENANAIGVAKTHEMLIHFHPANADEEAAAASNTFQEGVFCMASPGWMCATETLRTTPMQPYDPESFPEEERAISAMWDCERRLEEHTNDYGMWNFKDRHNSWIAEEKRWTVNRTWKNTHHGGPRLAWILYARSGDPKYLVYARRNTRQVMDLGFCHYSTPEFEALSYPRQKIKGALNDYKGLVHWHSGGRLFDYNNMADFLLFNYYMTGDRRGLDVLETWCEAAVERFRRPRAGRGGAGALAALLAAYQHSFDHRLLPLIGAYGRAMMGSQAPDGAIGGWHQYAPWLDRYHKFTGSQEAKECLLKWLDWQVEHLKTATAYGRAHLWMQAYGYHLTGREEHLAAAVGHVNMALDSIYLNPGQLYDGYWTRAISLSTGYFLQDFPSLLYMLRQHGEPVEPIYYGRQIVELGAGQWRVVAKAEKDTEVRFRTPLNTRGRNLSYRLTGPDGTVIAEGSAAPQTREIDVSAPPDGKTGEYALTLESEGTAEIVIPMTDMPQEVLDTGHQRTTFVRQPRVAFFVPEECERAVLDVMQFTDANSVTLYDGNDEQAARHFWVGAEQRAKQIAIAPRPEQRGQTWILNFGIKTKRNMLTLPEELPPYVAVGRERFFLPGGGHAWD